MVNVLQTTFWRLLLAWRHVTNSVRTPFASSGCRVAVRRLFTLRALVDYAYIRIDELTTVPAPGHEPHVPADDRRNISWSSVSDSFFITARPRLLAGRFPTREEEALGAPVAVVTRSLAHELFGDAA